MKGRSDDDLMKDEEEKLDLEVKDWKPHRPMTKGILIADPGRNPRFQEGKGHYDLNLILEPKDEVTRERAPATVQMSRQLGRSDDNNSSSAQSDPGIAREIESERDANIRKNFQNKVPTVNMEKFRDRDVGGAEKEEYPLELVVKYEQVETRGITHVRMAKQIGRQSEVDKNPDREELDLSPKDEASSR